MLKKLLIGAGAGLFLLIVIYVVAQIVSVQYTRAGLDNVPMEQVYGNPDGDVTVIEFVTYTCPYCRRYHPVLMNAIGKDGNVRYIPRPLPSVKNGAFMDDAALAYAAGEQGAFKLAHGALLLDPRIMDDGGLDAIIETLNFDDPEKLKADMKSDAVVKQIQNNINLATSLHIQSTPTYIIGKTMLTPSDKPPSVDDFLILFENAR